MKRLAAIAALMLMLTACGSKTVRFSVTLDTEDPVRISEVKAAIGRMVEGRMLAKKKTVVKQNLELEGSHGILTVAVSDAEAAELLKGGLTTPFTMAIMKQVGKGQGDIISEKYGEFKETGIDTNAFDWISAGAVQSDAGVSKGSVDILFTKEGQNLLKKVFAANRGSTIGIFVRGQLMSKKEVTATDTQTSIAIDGIPSADLAGAFADDVNVGLHAKFTAMP